MDFSAILVVVAPLVSILSLWRGWSTDRATKKMLDDFSRVNDRQAEQNERQADQIDGLIESVKPLVARL